ncbi:hypothetical protein MMC32_002956 [Xylographa parallela]|nr:hypothetical protein [Xylographa parallela]
MSKVKGIGGLVVATAFGVFNGILVHTYHEALLIGIGVFVFGPALKDQELQKLEHTCKTDEATQDVDQQISVAKNITSSSNVASPAYSGSDSALPTISPTWFFPKFQDWKTFWMEGDRASKEKITNSMVTKSDSSNDITKRTTEDAITTSNSANHEQSADQ